MAALARAEALDAEGRHGEALDTLAAAARRGGLTAGARLGARILVGDRAPELGAEGAGLIAAAAHGGGAEAAALLATLCAAGAYRPQSWVDALDWLQRAAALGLASAQRQLVVLASDGAPSPAGPVPAEDARPEAWQLLRDVIEIEALLAPPAAETLSADPLVMRFEGIASAATCAWIVGRARERLWRAEVYDERDSRGVVSRIRTNSTRAFSLAETDLVQIALQMRMAAAARIPFAHSEAASVLHYSAGEEFSDHYDFIDPATPQQAAHIAAVGQRMASFLVYLNDDYDGGETEFPRLGIKHKGRRGEGLMFCNAFPSGRPDERTLHAGRPPTHGEKWLASQFFRSRPVVPGAV